MMIPNRPDLELLPGVYQIRIGSLFQDYTTNLEVPQATVFYKLGNQRNNSFALDFNVYLLNLKSHVCQQQIGPPELSIETAANHMGLRLFFLRIAAILDAADIELGQIRYFEVDDKPSLDILNVQDMPRLFSLADRSGGINLFIVRSLVPSSLQVISHINPGVPATAGDDSSFGIALSLDTLCYRSWRTSARLVSHVIGRQMGLFRNREPASNIEDPIFDSSPDNNNLMFFADFGGSIISPGQATVLRTHPGLR